MKKATPTEYKGIIFRSKCEAVFARGLDLVSREILWEYEPKQFEVDGWIPDFYLCTKSWKTHKLHLWLIEFKPNIPTEAYKDCLLQRFLSDKLINMESSLIVGNPFDSSIPRTIEFADSSGWIKSTAPPEETFCFNKWNEALDYRFDLK